MPPKPSNVTSESAESEHQNVIHPSINTEISKNLAAELSKNLAVNEPLSEKPQNVDVTTSPIHTGSETSRSYQPEGKYFNYLLVLYRKFRQKYNY